MANEATEEELAEAIRSTPSLNSKFALSGAYVTERLAFDLERTIAAEAANRHHASSNLRWAAQFVRFSPFSFILMAVSGSTSYGSASKSRDLDFFCVSPKGSMWTELTKALIQARIFNLIHRGAPQICFSYVADEGYAGGMFSSEQGPLFAHDALQAVALVGPTRYRALLRKAPWMSSYYPRAFAERVRGSEEQSSPCHARSVFDRIVEALLFRVVSSYIRGKSALLNRKLARWEQPESVFEVRLGKDYLIYESKRYRKLKHRYEESLAFTRRNTGTQPVVQSDSSR